MRGAAPPLDSPPSLLRRSPEAFSSRSRSQPAAHVRAVQRPALHRAPTEPAASRGWPTARACDAAIAPAGPQAVSRVHRSPRGNVLRSRSANAGLLLANQGRPAAAPRCTGLNRLDLRRPTYGQLRQSDATLGDPRCLRRAKCGYGSTPRGSTRARVLRLALAWRRLVRR